jgi:DNA-binding NarL/FixJ family response regulator
VDLRRLTDRQYELLQYKCRTGASKRAVAAHFGLSYYTVHAHFRETLIRLDVHNLNQACRWLGHEEEATAWLD